MIKSLADGYDATYEKILLSIQEQCSQFVDEIKLVLQWLVVGFGPMSTTQLAEAVSICPEDSSLDFEGMLANTNEVIAPISQLVATRRVDGILFVYLLHKTVKDFLTSSTLAAGPAKQFHVDIGAAHARVGSICLQYLLFSDFDTELLLGPLGPFLKWDGLVSRGLSAPDKERAPSPRLARRYSLYVYAALHLPKHLAISESMNIAQHALLHRLAELWQAENKKKQDLWIQARRRYRNMEPLCREPIYYAIFTHLHSFMDILLPKLEDCNQYFEDGMTCLTAAALHNNVLAARKLIRFGANMNQATRPGMKGLAPLHIAAGGGHWEMVDLLLSAGADVHVRSTSKTTPFYRAARRGSVYILRQLHERGSLKSMRHLGTAGHHLWKRSKVRTSTQ